MKNINKNTLIKIIYLDNTVLYIGHKHIIKHLYKTLQAVNNSYKYRWYNKPLYTQKDNIQGIYINERNNIKLVSANNCFKLAVEWNNKYNTFVDVTNKQIKKFDFFQNYC